MASKTIDNQMISSELNKVKNIRAINRETVHKICSGQVVLSLAVAVKELVENSLDAGSSSIEIRLKEYGSELIEVSDNGGGVEEANFEALTLKHFTSKISEFSDLSSISTLGFRGEALSSLCALSNLSILTRHQSVDCGTRIEYDNNGRIKQKTSCFRQIGTTVSLANLFGSLPVRHKEFLKNLKREFHKMCQLLYAYCLISTGVRILCTNQTKNGARTIVVSTESSKTIRENIISIFGVKQLESLIEFRLHEPDENILEEFGLKNSTDTVFSFEGYISKCSHGSGRSASDRQFFFINSRPCEPTKIIKLINSIYKTFNGNQYPFICLNIKISQAQIDVNVTPDKRKIFMENEKLILATIKSSLLEMFKDFPSTFKLQNIDVKTKDNPQTENFKQLTKIGDKLLEINRGKKRQNEIIKPKGVMGFIFEKRLKIDEKEINYSEESDTEYEDPTFKPEIITKIKMDKELKSCLRGFKSDMSGLKTKIEGSDSKTIDVNETIDHQNETVDSQLGQLNVTFETNESVQQIEKLHIKTSEVETNIEDSDSKTIEVNENLNNKTIDHQNEVNLYKTVDSQLNITFETNESVQQIEKFNNKTTNNQIEFKTKAKDSNSRRIETDESVQEIEKLHIKTIETGVDELSNSKKILDVEVNDIKMILNKIQSTKNESSSSQVKFRSELTSKDAETELVRHISKDMFKNMEIIGQFNKGFIIVKLKSDIFIIDQHATDEKYNFEDLQKTTVIENQKLVFPKSLELTAANELLLMDNLDVFHKNGFVFDINENAEARKKVLLTAMPVSKNWTFGKEAIDELLFMLQEDASVRNFRPSKIRAMFASRACRKSIMVGQSLTLSQMRKIVDHMGEIEHPWNCPHGRPTMRHLINLDLIKIDEDYC